MVWKLHDKTDYDNFCTSAEKRHHKDLARKVVEDKMLKKQLSKAILISECPWCPLEWMCYESSMYNPSRRMCLNRSTETLRVWLWSTDIRPKIEIGETYGKLEIIKFDHKDKKGNLYFSCKCQCGRSTITRSSDILGGKTTSCGCSRGKSNKNERSRGNVLLSCEEDGEYYDLLEWRGKGCKVGAMMNPDHTRHVVSTEHHSKVGCKVDSLIEVKDPENPKDKSKNYKYFVDKTCSNCGAIIRTNSHAEQECDNCHLIN